MVEFHDLPRLPRRNPTWVIVLLVALVLFICMPLLARWVTELLWYRDVQRSDVYWTMFWGRWLLGGVVGICFFALVFANVYLSLRGTTEVAWMTLGRQLRERAIGMLDRTLRRVIFWGIGLLAALFALGVGRGAADYWPQFLLFTHAQRTGTVDPIFHHDVGFYLFRLPVWELLNHWLYLSLILALIFTALVYLATGSIRKLQGATISSRLARVHLAVLLALIFLVKATGYYLARFSILYSSNGLFLGAGYADMHAKLPGLHIMLALAVIAAVVTLVTAAFRQIRLLLWYVAGLIVASIVMLGIYPALVQRFYVVPNQREVEKPYIQHNIDMTRKAYGLDSIREEPLTPAANVTAATVQESAGTINNIRLWDPDTLREVYRQRQEIRSYYQIINIDIDRYRLNGQLRQVMLAAREMNYEQIPGQKTWVNRHLNYTHGYGVVMSPVNTFDADRREPVYFLKDIPPIPQYPELKITRPELYFGEAPDNYAVTFTKEKEFDYQRGESENVDTLYQEKGVGIPLRNPLVRALLAWRFGSLDLLISDSITSQSRLLFRRQVVQRAKAVAPFLTFDRDPYIIVGEDGRLYWILDAYTRSIRYPYAQYTDLEISGDNTVRSNYVRNPVKVVIDAYSGKTRCYVIDEKEPFIRAWSQVFPHMFQPMSAMPDGLAQHVRVPEGLFNAISQMYRRYHMKWANDFYRSVDLWEIASNPEQPAASSMTLEPATMPAYYTIMSMPGQLQPEYLLILPYTPSQKPNMIAWLSARSDPAHYGELQVYNFPAQSSFEAPGQTSARINVQPEISQALSLWRQLGSTVKMGNLLVIPIGGSLLYVQSVFLKAEQMPIPSLQRVIVADQERVVMRDTLEGALTALTGGKVATPPISPGVTPSPDSLYIPPLAPTANQRARAQSALDHYHRAQAALKQDDWAAYGKEMDAMRGDLEKLAK